MTRYNYNESTPKYTGFYKIYGSTGVCHAGFYTGSGFRCGPYLGCNLMVNIPMQDFDVVEWEVWK